MSAEFEVGDRVRYLRELQSNKPRVPSEAVGSVIRKKNGWVWVRFKNGTATFERWILAKNLQLEHHRCVACWFNPCQCRKAT